MLGAFPVAVEPMAVSAGPRLYPASFIAMIGSAAPESQYLVEIDAYIGGEARSGGLATLAEIPVAAIPKGGGVSVGQVTLRYADTHWVGDPTDADQPNVFYEGRVTTPLRITRSMPLLPEEERRSRRQLGDCELANGDGQLDTLVRSYATDGRDIRIKVGALGGAYDQYVTIADVLGTGWDGDEDRVRLGLRDRGFSLDLPLQTSLYAGTGGAEGTAEFEGKPKPLCFGRALNIALALIDPTNLIYQFHDGQIHAVDAVYDQGAALTATGTDVASYAALVSEAPGAGNYTTAKAVGMIKLGALPAGLVTADVRGDADPSYIDRLDTIAVRLLTVRHGLASRWIDLSSFAGAGARAGELGGYISQNETPTTADVISRLLAAVGGWWGTARDGRIRAGRLEDPANHSPNLFLDQFDIIKIEPREAPVPRWRQRVGYQPLGAVQRGEDLATAVTAARRQFLAEPVRIVQAADATVKARHLQALDPPPLPGLYFAAADAQTLANELLALHSPDRRIFDVTVKRRNYLIDLQRIVRITYPRHGLSGGFNFAVIGIDEQADSRGDRAVLTVWG